MTEDIIRRREEIAEQIRALNGMKKMAEIYGYDISEPAKNAHEAVQWLYFGYLAAVKDTKWCGYVSLGRTSTFLDIYAERDLAEGTLYRKRQLRRSIDQFVMKLQHASSLHEHRHTIPLFCRRS